MAETTNILLHRRSDNFIDENVDQFDAFEISWNQQQALHLTFGRTSLAVNNSKFIPKEDGIASWESGDIDVFRLNVAALTLPLETAKALAEVLTNMVRQAEARSANNAQ